MSRDDAPALGDRPDDGGRADRAGPGNPGQRGRRPAPPPVVGGEAAGTRPPPGRRGRQPGGRGAVGTGRGSRPGPVRPMTPPVILRRLAQAEFDDAADWYE